MSRKSWMRSGVDAWMLAAEASTVMGLRMLKLSMGGAAAQQEAARMVTEKVVAAQALQLQALTGGLGFTAHGAAGKTLAHYRRKVRANRKRLTGGTKRRKR